MANRAKSKFTDEQIMAFADGQCEPALAEKIAAAALTNVALARRINMFSDSSKLLQTAFPPLADKAADDRIAALIRGTQNPSTENVVAFRPAKKPLAVYWSQAMAASVALTIGLLGGYYFSMQKNDGASLAFATLDTETVNLLGTKPSGHTQVLGANAVTVIASFKDAQGHFCREIESVGVANEKTVIIACDRGQSWQVVMQTTIATETNTFVPAGGAQALDAFLASSGMTEPLSLAEELQLLKIK